MELIYLPTTNTQLVVPLPPMFSIASRLRAFDLVVAGRAGDLLDASSIWRTPVAPTGWPRR